MMSKLIAISGSPAVGKSILAKRLATKLKFSRLDLHNYYKKISSGYNRSQQCYDIDIHKFKKLVQEKVNRSKRGLIIDSHISHLLPGRMVDLCIVLICSDLKKLYARLKKRKYSKQKIRENLDAEIFQICLNEAKENRHKLIIIDTGKKMDWNKTISQITKSL